jgi:guanine nucleotide-binding protein subunit gamma
MAELKLRRLTELNARLREDLDRPRIKVSDACQS